MWSQEIAKKDDYFWGWFRPTPCWHRHAGTSSCHKMSQRDWQAGNSYQGNHFQIEILMSSF